MVSEAALASIAVELDLKADDTVLEVGPGLGFLTAVLAEKAGRLIAVELDKRFCVYLKERFANQPNVEIVQSDVLEFGFGALKAPIKFTGNVPYQISSPLLEVLQEHRALWSDAVLTFQKDFAKRLASGPGTRDRSALSAWTELHAAVTILKEFQKTDFYPAPKIDSVLVRVRYFDKPLYPPEDGETIRQCIRAGFQKRRKNILNALTSSSIGFDKKTLESCLQSAGVRTTARAEVLTSDDWLRLGRSVRLLS